jgi:hypothetical protein
MARRKVSDTAAAYTAQPLAPSTRREMSVRRLLDRHGDPLDILGRLMAEGDKDAAKALLPYCYPALKAVELTGAGGEALTVQVIKLPSPAPQ